MAKRSVAGALVNLSAREGSAASFLAAEQGKKYGPAQVALLSQSSTSDIPDWISTQNPLIDAAIGHPGVPVGRPSLLCGETSCGKTTLCYHLIAECQRRGGLAILIDAEQAALDEVRARQLGVDPTNLLVYTPATIEQAFKMLEDALDTRQQHFPDILTLVIFDSVAGLGTENEYEGEYGKAQMGKQALVVGQAMRKIVPRVAQEKFALVMVNQWREKIGVTFGPSKTMIAETPLSFASTVTLEMQRIQKWTEGEGEQKRSVGIVTKVYCSKNKVAPPFKTESIKLRFDSGIDTIHGLFVMGVRNGIIDKPSQGWFQVGEHKFRESQFEQILRDDPTLIRKIVDSMNLPEPYPPESKILNPFDDPIVTEEAEAV